ncbi:hypothetical protein DL765_007643 [Monosporascus sp. GIB2]|nr:hypothetical protein DL765_007643 [Monosporascus sp. GIB2]
MVKQGRPIQDYTVVHEQDLFVSENGKVTGEEKVGGLQVETIPMKKEVPAELNIRYQNHEDKTITRTINIAKHNIASQSNWLHMKKTLQEEFGIS